MIWGDDWTQVATQKSDGPQRFCTSLKPPRTKLPDDVQLQIVTEVTQDWLDLVGTRWSTEEAALRLADASVPCLFRGDELVATCVLRQQGDIWILETLRARKGLGTPLIRAVIPWIWDKAGPFIMGYTWELSLPALIGAWWRGWLRSAAEIQYGWSWFLDSDDCNFCPSNAWEPLGPRLAMPTYFQDQDGLAVVSDSGLMDGWGHVLTVKGVPDWSAVAKKGGWRRLWMRSTVSPGPGWSWTGEFVVVGLLNYNSGPISLDWITAEI